MSIKRPDATDEFVGARIRALRMARGLSQTALGVHLGVTFQQVQKYEQGKNRIGAGRLQTIANFLNVQVSDLMPASGATAPIDDPCANLAATRRGPRVARAFNALMERNTELADSFLRTLECAAFPAEQQKAA